MMFFVDKKTGFLASGETYILDEEKKPFYLNAPKQGRFLAFNLPKGVYFLASKNELKKIKKPLDFGAVKIPHTNREVVKGEISNIFKVKNLGDKAHVIWNEKNSGENNIYLDKDFFEGLGRLGKEFILNHEKAHKFYDGSERGEVFCDLFAINKMLKEGYNPSQLYAISCHTLDLKKSSYRVTEVNKRLKEILT